jgi:precorrin-3B C17-methyltransferase / cobalt-factor III methyltransferase
MSGSLRIVGLGPGDPSLRTRAAERAIRAADVVAGYGPYVDQCADLLDGQEVLRGRMGEEEERALEAVARAAAGARVALVSSGDAGVHGMAARTLTAAGELDDVAVIPGVTAALAAAARIGAPLADDWATLSLSDINVPWGTVAHRLTALAASGIALALYNPQSRSRPLERALLLLRGHRPADTPAFVATDVFRPGESVIRTVLGGIDPGTVTMRSLLLIAGESARWDGRWLVATRGTA